jgi:biotin/methionine sulfoxide reductase
MHGRNAQAGIELPSYEAFREQGWYRFPAPERDFVLFDTFREDPNAHPLSTRSGRIELWSETIEGYRLPDCLPHPAWLPPAEWLGAEQAARFPLHLVTVQPVDKLHSQGDFGPVCRARKVSGHEPVTIHPREAEARGLAAGDVVRVHNERGACLAGVIVDEGVREGVAIMSTGAWYTPEDAGERPLELLGNPNVLAFDRGTSALAQGASGLSILVQIEKYAGTARPDKAWQPPEVVAA